MAVVLLLTACLLSGLVPVSTRTGPTHDPVRSLPGIGETSRQGSQQYSLPPNQYLPFAADAHYGGVKLKFQVSASTDLDIYVMTSAQEARCCSAGYLYHWSGGNVSEEVPLPGVGLYYLVVDNDISAGEAVFSAWSTTVPVDITLGHNMSPAPVGIVDYGVKTSGGNASAYQLEMSSVSGTVLLNAAKAFVSEPPTGASEYGAGLQLNVELRINATSGSYVYWLQNALLFYTNNDTANFNDNVWNQTTPSSGLDSTHISGKGSVLPTPAGQAQPNYYADATPYFNYTSPLDVKFQTTVSHSGDAVSVAFATTRGANVSEQIPPQVFDTVKISERGLVYDASIIVSGFEPNPFGSYYDAELVYGGNCCGAVTTFDTMNSTLSMSYVLDSGSVMAPTSLFEYGSNTAEGVDNLAVTPSLNQTHGASYLISIGKTNFDADFVRQTSSPITLNLSYSVLGGRYSGTAPSISYVVNGTEIVKSLSNAAQTFQADPGTAWQIVTSNPNPSERLATTQRTAGIASTSVNINFSYYHQFLVSFNFTLISGTGYAAPNPPYVTYTQYGSSVTSGVGISWVDAGSTYSFPQQLNGSIPLERWVSGNPAGVVNGAGGVVVTYQHQYYVTVVPSAGGSVSPVTGWYDAGSSLDLVASPQQGWNLGLWNGTGASSYSGNETTVRVQANGAIAERATFFPGLMIVSSGDGSVGYSFADELGGGQGSVPSGSTKTIYVPLGTLVTVTATSAGPFSSFESWSGNLSGAQASGTVLVDSAISVTANFVLNLADLGILVIAVLVVVALGALVYSRQRGPGGL